MTLQNRVIARARLDATADLTFVKEAINTIYAQLVVENEWLVSSASFTLTANTASYDLTSLASGVQRIKTAYITSGGVVGRPLVQVSLERIVAPRQGTGGAATATGTSTQYALAGYKQLELYPTPAAADTLTIFYVALPTALSGDTDSLILPEPYGSQAVLYGALVEAGDLQGDPAGADWERKFDLWTARLRSHLRRRSGGQPGQFEFTPGASPVPHDRATILPA